MLIRRDFMERTKQPMPWACITLQSAAGTGKEYSKEGTAGATGTPSFPERRLSDSGSR